MRFYAWLYFPKCSRKCESRSLKIYGNWWLTGIDPTMVLCVVFFARLVSQNAVEKQDRKTHHTLSHRMTPVAQWYISIFRDIFCATFPVVLVYIDWIFEQLIWCAWGRRWAASCCLWSINMSFILEDRCAKWQLLFIYKEKQMDYTMKVSVHTVPYLSSSYFSTNHRHSHGN